jgi:peptidylprolyl isomerase/peptidyl-prolyl cis-trans isomerase D
MAILANIRKQKFVLIAIIALALFAFVVGGSKIFGNNGRVERSIGEINGQQVDYKAFQDKVAQLTKNPNTSAMQAAERVWNDEVKTTLLNQEFDELGITVGADQLWDMLTSNPSIQGDPNFKDETGSFSPVLLKEFLEDLKNSKNPADKNRLKLWADFEKTLAQSQKETIYNNFVKAAVATTEKEAEFSYKNENEKVTFKYVKVPYTSIKDEEIKVSDAEINSYIQSHKAAFKVEPSRNIAYVKVDEKASLDDENKYRNDLRNLINGVVNKVTNATDAGFAKTKNVAQFVAEHSDIKYNPAYIAEAKLPAVLKDTLSKLPVGAIYGPYKDGDYFKVAKIEAIKMIADSAKAKHILISYQGAASQGNRTEAAAKKLVDSLLTVVKADKSKLEQLAKDFSDDKGSGAKGGDLGKFAYTTMVPAFRDYVFENNKGDVGLVKSRFGYHIIRIDDLIGSSKAYKLAIVAKKNLPSKATSSALFSKASKIELEAAKPAAKFTDIAKANGLTVKPINNLKVLDENLPELGKRREIVRWLYEADRKVGDVKKFNVKGGQVIARVEAINNSTVKSAKEAKSKVYPILMNAKKAKLITPKLNGTDLVEIAKANNVNVTQATSVTRTSATIPASGKEPKVVGEAFAMDIDAVSKPIVGEKGVYVIKLIKKEEAPKLSNFKGQAQQKQKTLQAKAATDAFKALKEASDIEDNRKVIF